MNIRFSSSFELKQRLLPALKLRSKNLKKQGILINEEQLWQYFIDNYWKKANNLHLYQMVDDILNKDIQNNQHKYIEGEYYE